jgi:hypothetical protein
MSAPNRDEAIAWEQLSALFEHRSDVRAALIGGELACKCTWCVRLETILGALNVAFEDRKITKQGRY